MRSSPWASRSKKCRLRQRKLCGGCHKDRHKRSLRRSVIVHVGRNKGGGRIHRVMLLTLVIASCEKQVMLMELHDKIAVVTGGRRGIGRAIAVAYAREGADLVLAARSIEALNETRAAVESLGCKALVVPTDVRHEESVRDLAEQALSHFGRVDVL